jgi:hemolysin III
MDCIIMISTSKPLLRGASHQVAFFLALLATAWLLRVARLGPQAMFTSIFGGSLVVLFGTSALYHRVRWRPGTLRWMQRLDHSAIFVAIAGGFTPLFGLVHAGERGHGALLAIWLGALVGIVVSFAWPDSPGWVKTSLCILVGLVGAGPAIERVAAVGVQTIAPLLAAGLIYAVGGFVYATRRPDPYPRVFGYHEVFHALIILGTVPLFAHVALVLEQT